MEDHIILVVNMFQETYEESTYDYYILVNYFYFNFIPSSSAL